VSKAYDNLKIQYGAKLIPLDDIKRFIASTVFFIVHKLQVKDTKRLIQFVSDTTKDQLHSKMIHFEESQAFSELD